MQRTRLDSEGRRLAIVEAAAPLFARKGFAGTTTREIARAAGVSEALVFQHFPTKAALYQEIVAQGCRGDVEFERFLALPPSTQTLVNLALGMADYFLGGPVHESLESREIRNRLICQSYLEDGEFGRLMNCWANENIGPLFSACLAAARDSGDLNGEELTPLNAFHFGASVVACIAYSRLSGHEMAAFSGDRAALGREASIFMLRGFGLSEDAIARHVPSTEQLRARPDASLCCSSFNPTPTAD